MKQNVFYYDAKNAIINFFDMEFPIYNKNFLNKFLNSCYGLCHYEEEGSKVRPNIIITNCISAVVKQIPSTYKVIVHKDIDDSFFDQRMKSLMCFCKEDWYVYINFLPDCVEYGLLKTINSIKEKNFKQLLFEQDNSVALQTKGFVMNVDVISTSTLVLCGIRGNKTLLNFDIDAKIGDNWEDVIAKFVDASLSKLKTTKKKKFEIATLYHNIFVKAFKNLHGTICLVVDKDFEDKKGILSDGIWLSEPIQLSKLFLQTNSYNESKLTSFADLFVKMLDYDGATVVDNAGRIRAYNVFVTSSVKMNKTFVGGARKRAVQTMLDSSNKKYVGVYMQSYEGDNFFDFCKAYKNSKTAQKTLLKNTDEKIDKTHQLTLSDLEPKDSK